jgi:hypothetical protein
MRRLFLSLFSLAIVLIVLVPLDSKGGQRNKVVVRPTRVVVRKPVVHARLVVHPGHPIRRALPAAVLFRPARRVVTVTAPLVYLPSPLWSQESLLCRQATGWFGRTTR